MMRAPVVIIGAGFGGLTAAVELALAGCRVVVFERAATVGGKAQAIDVGGTAVDVGPTVLTMRHVFDQLFERAGARLDHAVRLVASPVIARHAFADDTVLDLFTDIDRTSEAIARFAGAADAHGYRRFAQHSREIAEIVREPFLESERPTLADVVRRAGTIGLGALSRIDAHRSMWRALRSYFRDARLVQLFARYATYVGSSPFEAPATFNLVSHVEREGVYAVDGGMPALARAVADLARSIGVEFRLETAVREVVSDRGRAIGIVVEDARGAAYRSFVEAESVIANADVTTVACGALGSAAASSVPRARRERRSLSAMTWAIVGRVEGFPLEHHSVFFSHDYETEFTALFRDRRVPDDPTVYVCAEDRSALAADVPPPRNGDERLFVIVNAPADADGMPPTREETERCERAMRARLARAGLNLTITASRRMTPTFYERAAPGTGGAIYGEAAHGSLAPLSRPSSRTKLRGFFLAGGSIHPGPGVPMAARSGILAARALLSDLAANSARASTSASHRAGTGGSTSTA